MKQMVLRRGECLKLAPDVLRSDGNTVLKAVRSNPSAYVYASDELQNDRKFVKPVIALGCIFRLSGILTACIRYAP